MKKGDRIRCRVVACPEALADDEQWSFYLINDCSAPLDSAVLKKVSNEWGDRGYSKTADVHVTRLAPGAQALIWRDDGELRTKLSLLVRMGEREVRLSFEFPKLYIQRSLSFVDGLGRYGWEESAEG